MNRHEIGLQELVKVFGKESTEATVDMLREIYVPFADFLIGTFGDMYSDEVLDLKAKELLVIASLISQRDTRPQLKIHIKAALKAGLSKREILASILHLVLYVGFPATINALTAAKEAFTELESA